MLCKIVVLEDHCTRSVPQAYCGHRGAGTCQPQQIFSSSIATPSVTLGRRRLVKAVLIIFGKGPRSDTRTATKCR
jgi:hypothetical protein